MYPPRCLCIKSEADGFSLTMLDRNPVTIRDFTGPAVSFFNNHRVPAALLAATAIKDAFVLQGRRDNGAVTRTWRACS